MKEKIHVCQEKYGELYYAVFNCGLGATIETCIDIDHNNVVLNNDFIAKKMFKIAFKSENIIRFSNFLVKLRDAYRLYYQSLGQNKELEYTTYDKRDCNKYVGLDGTDQMKDVRDLSAETFCILLNQMNKFSFEFDEIGRASYKKKSYDLFFYCKNLFLTINGNILYCLYLRKNGGGENV